MDTLSISDDYIKEREETKEVVDVDKLGLGDKDNAIKTDFLKQRNALVSLLILQEELSRDGKIHINT